MVQLRLTERIRIAFNITASSLVEPSECTDGLGSWTLNIFKVGNQKAIIFVNDRTLYSFIIYGLRKDNSFDLPGVFLKGFVQLLSGDGFSSREIEYLISGCDDILFTKTNSKSVLGNLNDLVSQYQVLVQDYGGFPNANIGHIIYQLNRMPQRNIGWKESVDKVKSIVRSI